MLVAALHGSRANNSTYTDDYKAPGLGRPAKGRPSSVTRRNNPHPKPGFLFPKRLPCEHGVIQDRVRQLVDNYISTLSPYSCYHLPSCTADLFPPVKGVAAPQKEGRLALLMQKTQPKETDRVQLLLSPLTLPGPDFHRLGSHSGSVFRAPTAGQLNRLQGLDPRVCGSPANEKKLQTILHNIERTMHVSKTQDSPHANPRPHPCPKTLRFKTALDFRAIPNYEPPKVHDSCPEYTKYSSSSPQPVPLAYQNRFRPKTAVDFRCEYSCFQVVKKSQPGHYIIHPEFVSERIT
ncbi:uncharacterized protein LOC121303503 [Polyodon spathula]|uniref:uncharacterized protein LOC121303503 n=1 Tax=Polyodon spathula TaxID=7913 RepID=UPI001B7DE917|nr:uncharacterized protein LOC121303503 [Polyodon spathula]